MEKDSKLARPPMHPEDPRERAKKRAQEILDHIGAIDDATDKFYIPPHLIPDGWTWEWKVWTVYNQENPTEISALLRAGWEFVEMKPEYADLVGPDYNQKRIFREGQVLMEVPTEVYEEFKSRDRRRAGLQVRQKEEQVAQSPVPNLPPGFATDNKGQPIRGRGVAGPRTTWEAGMPVPD